MKKIFIALIACIFTITSYSAEKVVLKNKKNILSKYSTYNNNKLKLDNGKIINKKNVKTVFFNVTKEKKVKNIIKHTADISSEVKKIFNNVEKYKKKYPDAGVITLIDDGEYQYYPDGTNSYTAHIRAVILKETHKGYGVGGTYFINGRDKVELIMARTIKKDGTIIPFDRKNIKISKPTGRGDSFTAGSTFIFNLPEVEVGSIIEYKYKKTNYKPAKKEFFFPSYLFQDTEPVIFTRCKVIIPENKTLYYAAKNFPNGNNEPTITKKDNNKIYTWQLNEPPIIVKEPSMPAMKDAVASMYSCIFNDWNIVYNWLEGYYKENCKATPEIKEFVKPIVKNCKTDEEKVAAIYHWIQKNIRYIIIKGDMSTIYGSYKGDVILKRKFGCCVDKAVLFSEMLDAVNIKSTPIILNTTGGEDINPKIPRIYLEHAISCVYLNGKRVVLDSTGYNSRYPSFSVGDQGVFALNPLEKKLQYIPQGKPSSVLAKYNNIIKMDEKGNCDITYWTKYNGAYETWIRGYWKNVKESEIRQKFQQMCNSVSSKTKLISYKLVNLNDISRPFYMTRKYKIFDYPTFASDLVIFSLPDHSYYFRELRLEKRKYDLEYGFPFQKEHTYSIEIPKNMKVLYLPKPLDITHKYFSYHGKYIQKGNKIIYTDSYKRQCRYVRVNEYKEYRALHMKIEKYAEENIFLKKIKKGGEK